MARRVAGEAGASSRHSQHLLMGLLESINPFLEVDVLGGKLSLHGRGLVSVLQRWKGEGGGQESGMVLSAPCTETSVAPCHRRGRTVPW